jgi:hypothetical protein
MTLHRQALTVHAAERRGHPAAWRQQRLVLENDGLAMIDETSSQVVPELLERLSFEVFQQRSSALVSCRPNCSFLHLKHHVR